MIPSVIELIMQLTDYARNFSVDLNPDSKQGMLGTEKGRRSRKKIRFPGKVEAVRANHLRQMAVDGLVKSFCLERCAFVLQDSEREGVWTIKNKFGVPDQILKNSDYTRAEGLTGLVLQGKVIVSQSILDDPRRSKRYGGTWISDSSESETSSREPKCYVGVPLWKQTSDRVNEYCGALYGVRSSKSFSEDESFAFQLVAHVVSFGQDRLRSWRKRAESDIRQLQLSRLWRMPISESQKYQKLLEFIQEEFPFARLLLSLVDTTGRKIRGVAALGFRSDIVTETNRDIVYSENEDILSMVIRKKSPFPLFVPPDSKYWEKVDRITSFRHQVRNPLLLVPMMSRKGGVLGILLIELPNNAKALSWFEVERLSLFVNHAATLIEGHRSSEFARSKRVALDSMETRCGMIAAELDSKYQAKQLRNIVRVMCEHLGFKTALLYRVDSSNSVLFGDTGYGLNSSDILSKFVPISPYLVAGPLPLAIKAFHQSQTCRYNPDYFDKRTDPSVPSPLFGYTIGSSSINKDGGHGLVNDNVPCRRSNSKSFTNTKIRTEHFSHGVYASPITSGNVCMGVLVYSATTYTDLRDLNRATKPFFSIIGRSLSMMEASGRLQAAEKQASAFKSFALAANELTTGASILNLEKQENGLKSTVWKSMLKDIASMFDAALAQVFCFKNPIVLDNISTDIIKLQGESLYEEGTFVVDESDLPSHFSSRIQSIAELEPRKIKIGEKSGLTQSVLLSLKPVRSHNVEVDEAWSRTVRELNGCRAFAGIPLTKSINGSTFVYGVLTLTRLRIDARDARIFRYEEILTLDSIAYLISSALAQEELIDSKTEHMMSQVQKCLRWFRHDIPGMITNIRDMVERLSKRDNTDESFEDLKELTEATRSIFQACAIGLGEKPSSKNFSADGDSKSGLIQDNVLDFACIEARVKLLLAYKADLKGDTVLKFLLNEPRICSGISSTLVLYVCYALVDNALTACLENKEKTKDKPGNVEVEMKLTDAELVISVTDDAGGLQGMQWSTISKELFSGWSKKVGSDHSGMGLHIVSRIVEGILGGSVSADNIKNPESNRRGARFVVTIPRPSGFQ